MGNNLFGPMEIDAIGEIMNISLGSSATAVSNMLGHRVDITTPRVTVLDAAELQLGDLDPAVGVEIRYVSGLSGSNIMLLKRGDVKTIVDILMGTETPDSEFELNDLTISAVCEVMNQMMGAASTALSDFLGRMVNISTPESFEVDNFEQFKAEHLVPNTGTIVAVHFCLSIENSLHSEFINVISVELARDLISGFGLEDGDSTVPAPALSDEEIQRMLDTATPEPAPAAAPAPASTGGTLSQEEIERLMGHPPSPPASSSGSASLSQEEIERLMGSPPSPPAAASGSASLSQAEIERLVASPPAQSPPDASLASGPGGEMTPPPPPPGYYPPPGQGHPGYYPPPGYYYPPMPHHPDPKLIQTQPVSIPQMNLPEQLGEEQAQNLDLILTVPLEVSVEIGRTRRKVQDILTFSKGSLVVLDKLAGDQVDLFVNGQCIARGDVVVVDDNFGIRITEILKPATPSELLQQ